ncbi:hypothetical protein BSLG_006008 [Batrachochytrium salamandrivorans]|nr:hypothetical protein BSLG_006008 [Batrachochytrium salamandrivorans]
MDAPLEFIDISKIPTNEHLRAVYKALSSASTITLASYTSTNIDPLELLQPNHHTFAYVCILNARMARHSSAIQIEAYKRFILVSLLANGALLLPKTVSPVVARVCKSLTLQYAEFATAYSSHSLARATTKASQYASKFETDKTNGLVHQAVGLNELDVMTGSESTLEAEAHVVRMIDDRQILATISHLDGGMVSFHDVFNGLDTLSTTATLEDQIATLMARDTDAQIWTEKSALSQNYLQNYTR